MCDVFIIWKGPPLEGCGHEPGRHKSAKRNGNFDEFVLVEMLLSFSSSQGILTEYVFFVDPYLDVSEKKHHNIFCTK